TLEPVGERSAIETASARAVGITAGAAVVEADLTVPSDAAGVVVFAHGSGSGRHSPRNRQVAAALRRASFATLLADLLTADEEQVDARTSRLRFDIRLLARRLVSILDWTASEPATRGLPTGVFGASTGAAAALVAAAARPEGVAA